MALLVTCLVDVFDPAVASAAVRVLEATGFDVDVPLGQTCCGQPAWNSGHHAAAAKVARTTLDVLHDALAAGAGAVVVPAGSCTTMLRLYWPVLFDQLGDERAARRAREVAARTFELTEFIAARKGGLRRRLARPTAVAWHHSCHMLRELHLREQPLELLDSIESCSRAEWPDAERCCGFGGLFSLKLPETSVAMADQKLESLPDPAATVVAGADTSCLLHMRTRAEAAGIPLRTVHVAELLAEALEGANGRPDSPRAPDPAPGPPDASRAAGTAPDGPSARSPAVPGDSPAAPSAASAHGWQLGKGALRSRTASAVADPVLQPRLRRAVDRFTLGRAFGMAELHDPDGLRHAARAVKRSIVADLPALLGRFADQVVAAGGHVHWSPDAGDANTYIAELARRMAANRLPGSRAGPPRIVKSKSMITEEIGLDEALEGAGCEVVETDLGEWIVQLAGEKPSHIIAPALHHDRHSIREIFRAGAGAPDALPAVPEELNAFARSELRKRFLEADVGVTGANFAVAQTGSVVLVTNEGNGRMVSSLPRAHVVVLGAERVVANWDQLDLLLTLLTRSATGQRLTSYTSVITGPRRSAEHDGPAELHVLVLDNGRSSLTGSDYEEMLDCIRCGACLNVCPVYRQVGGHAYGWAYTGPMGAVLTPLLAADRQSAQELSDASTLCGACMEACPVEIPLQDLLLTHRRDRAETSASWAERASWNAWAALWSSTAGYEATTRAATLGRRAAEHPWLVPGGRSWGEGRTLPVPATQRFRDRWRSRSRETEDRR